MSSRGSSHAAITLTADLLDQLKGCACSFHAATNAIKRSSRWARSAKSAMRRRLRCRMLNHCSVSPYYCTSFDYVSTSFDLLQKASLRCYR